jgi:hypothetical protein
MAFWGYSSQAQEVFINEIHYDNSGTDTGEAIEIAGPAGTDLTGWAIVRYNGANGLVYTSPSPLTGLSGSLPDSGNGFGFVSVTYPSNGLQNGAPDGIALVDDMGNVIQFLSYEGTFTALDGPAIGLLSTDFGVAETGSEAIGFSLQLSGTGKVYSDFSWQAPAANTFGTVNTGQTFTGEPVVFINEFHYDNTGTDSDEGIEVAGTAGTNLTGWSLVLYNGNGGASYGTTNLSGILPNQNNGFGTAFFAISGLQNGSPDGFALVNPANEVIQFLSYEGSFLAVGGPADGLTSEDVGVSQPSTALVGTSLQLQGSGTKYADFTWSETIARTYNQINTGQDFGGVVVNPDPVLITIAEARTKPQGSIVLVKGILTVSDQLGGPAFIQDNTGGIPVFDTDIHGAGLFQIGDEIKFLATVGAFQQQIQLGNVSEIELISQGNAITPLMTTIDQISPSLEGQLIEIPAASFVIAKGLLFPDSNYLINDGSGNLELRIDGQVSSLIGREIPTEPQMIRGVLGSFQGNLQLLPRFIADLPGTTAFEPEGSDIPTSETLDVMTWNMEFFGATITNFGPSDVTLQAANALKVFQATLPDVIAVQEVSDEALLASVVAQLPGYAVICSDRFSRSFETPDPTFPPQKLCLIYNTAVVEILDTKVLFEQIYDEARMGMNDLLDSYPTGTPSSFWSSGRLPWLVTAIADINGVKEKINFINIHAKSGSSNEDLLRKRFDNQVLKDTLDAFYSDQNIVLLGDYNDDLDESIGGGLTTYDVIISDPDFDGVTISLSEAGLRSFIFNDNVIDHITLSNELYDNYLEGSETLYIPFNTIENYANTTSDHLPVSVRFLPGEPILSDAGEGAVVYLGYEPLASTTLRAADATGGNGAYTYSWSDGQVGQEIVVSPTQTTTYILTVTDEAGNTFTDEVTVCVVDVRGDRKGRKVIVCLPVGKSGRKITLNVATQAVPALLKLGATLGACGVVPCGGSGELPVEEIDFSSAKIRKIFPNPFEDQVTVELNQQLDLEVSYVLFNHRGETITSGVSSFANGRLTLQFTDTKLRKGIYYLHLTQGQERKIIRLFKR